MPDAVEPSFSSPFPDTVAVINRKRAALMAAQVRVCRSFLSRFMGLMMRRRLGEEQGALLVMTTTSRIDSAIHMLFVFFPLAIFWLDEEGMVVSRCLARPWRPVYLPRQPARYVLELSASLFDSAVEGDHLGLDAAGAAG
jgi:uncharacterized membrane protein (UPF0127 family)